jgi:hypothetical protein
MYACRQACTSKEMRNGYMYEVITSSPIRFGKNRSVIAINKSQDGEHRLRITKFAFFHSIQIKCFQAYFISFSKSCCNTRCETEHRTLFSEMWRSVVWQVVTNITAKRRKPSTRLHGNTFQNVVIFIVNNKSSTVNAWAGIAQSV